MFDSSNSYFRNCCPIIQIPWKWERITGVYNLHDEILEDDTEDAEFQDAPQPDQPDQPTAVNQPTLEVIVTDQQCTITFNGETSTYLWGSDTSKSKSKSTSLKLLQSVKLKTMFIPLAPTTSTTSTPSSPSPSTSPLDDGITTIKHYIYIHTNHNPRIDATTKTYHCNWQDNIKCQSHCIYTSTCPLQMLSRDVWILQQRQ